VGGVEPRRANVRLVAATHRDLDSMIEEGTFRRDLYYRISAFPIHLPALRERPDDIPRLAQSILGRLQPYRALRIDDEAMALLCAYDYPGNVRELRNILERASLLANNDRIRPKHLPVYVRGAAHSDIERGQFEATQPPLQSAERATLQQVLARNAGNRAATARALGISERSLYRKLAKLGLARSRNKTK
jgi:transcriptional regulator with PAS, ATPase and Fis domain